MKRKISEESLLSKCIEEDVWSIILPLFSVIDLLVMCLLTKEYRTFFKSCLADMKNLVLSAMENCKECGSQLWCHRCPSIFCLTDVKVLMICDEPRIQVSYPIHSLSIIGVGRTVLIEMKMREPIYMDWYGEPTFLRDEFLVRVLLHYNDYEHEESAVNMYYKYGDGLLEAYRFHYPSIQSLKLVERGKK